MRSILAIIILLSVALITLGGYLFEDFLAPILVLIVDWGLLILGTTLLMGIGYLQKTHIQRLFQSQKGAFLSAVILLTFSFTLISGLILPLQNEFFSQLILNIQVPVEASLLAVLAVVMFSASLRIIHTQGVNLLSISFLISALIALVIKSGIFQSQSNPVATQILAFVNRLPLAGARGILIGMALGGLLVGLRVLLAFDRPYGEE